MGGRLEPEDGDGIQGFVGIYDRAFPVVQQEGQWVPRGSLRRDRPGLSLGRSRLTLRAGRGYNRVEGLPILFGPVIRTPGTYPLRMEALATFRTETFSLDELGYWFRLEQSFGGPARPRLGLMAYSEVQPMEERGVSDLESSITTLILHRDLRDYFQNEGWGVYVDMERTDFPLTARLSFRQEDHFPVEPGDPLTIFRRDRLWRPMPLAAQGEITSLALDMELDDRNNPDDPTDGWYVKASVMRGLNGELEVPGTSLSPLGPTIQGPTFLPEDIALGSLDVRRYARVDPDSDLRLRLFVGGSINGNPLPPQYQQTLGGVGSLPGFERFTLDCGARSAPVFVQNEEGQ